MGFRVWGSGLGFRVWGLGLGFRVWGFRGLGLSSGLWFGLEFKEYKVSGFMMSSAAGRKLGARILC